VSAEPGEPGRGWISGDVAAEFADLRLLHLELEASPGRSPREVRQQLKDLSDRFRGAQAVAMRRQPVPWAYRVFFRQIGLDPDTTRTPIEAAAVERLLKGGWRSQNIVDDALTIALIETGVPIWALDATQVEGELGIRTATAGEPLGRAQDAPPLPVGRLVVADERSPLAVLFGDLAPGHGLTPASRNILLFCVQVAGVPTIHAEEALHSCAMTLLQ
jgi:DNA/RNA-binding domain of Phe-tRNA-synthetase-like protein